MAEEEAAVPPKLAPTPVSASPVEGNEKIPKLSPTQVSAPPFEVNEKIPKLAPTQVSASPVEADEKIPHIGEVVSGRHQQYEIQKLLGKGGFGSVFMVRRHSDNHMLALKCEAYNVKKRLLVMDCKVLRGAMLIRSPHFCTVFDRGKVVNRFCFLVMTMVGKNLWDLRVAMPRSRFSLSTSLKCAEQCLMAIQDLHKIRFLHRDIKPGNFAMGREEAEDRHVVFMLDFGLCRKFVRNELKDLRIPRSSAPFRGTTRYAPIAALKQMEQSRKDDLEAWLYMIVEWTAGRLPWRKLRGPDKEEVLRWKEEVRSGECMEEFFKECPKRHFCAIMQYIDKLVYQSIPDYEYIHYCLAHANKLSNIDPHEPLDWDPHRPYRGPTKADLDRRDTTTPSADTDKSPNEGTTPTAASTEDKQTTKENDKETT